MLGELWKDYLLRTFPGTLQHGVVFNEMKITFKGFRLIEERMYNEKD